MKRFKKLGKTVIILWLDCLLLVWKLRLVSQVYEHGPTWPVCWCVYVLSRFGRVWLFATSWTIAHQSLSMGLPRREYWSGLHFFLQGSSPPRDKTASLTSPALVDRFFITSSTFEGLIQVSGMLIQVSKTKSLEACCCYRLNWLGTQPQLPCGSGFCVSAVRPAVQGGKPWGSGSGWPCALDLVNGKGVRFPSAPCTFVVLFMDDLGSFPPEPASCLVGFPAQKPPVWPDTQIWSNPSWLCTNCWG